MRLLPIMSKESSIAILRYEQDHAQELKHAATAKARAAYYHGLIRTYNLNCPLARVEEPEVAQVWYTKYIHEGGKRYKTVHYADVLSVADNGSILIQDKKHACAVSLPLSRILCVSTR